ncbi:MAG: hypothetical protein F7B17_07280 [Desulfurococcales archaeon]|nr:hypothetical protein [Desulfurococcales archaeon]
MGREERLKWLEMLDGRARFYMWVSVALVLAVLGSGALLEDSPRAYAVAGLSALLAAMAALRAYTLSRTIDREWGEVLKRDPAEARLDALTLLAMALIAFIGVVLIRLLLG